MAGPSQDPGRSAPEAFGGTPTEGRRLSSRGRATIARLLDAGRDVMAERGFAELRVDDVVERAGISHGTFYLYFADKQDLLESLMRRCTAELRELSARLPALDRSTAGRRRLRTWLADFHDVYGRHGVVLDAWLADAPGRVEGRDETALGPLRDAFEARLAQASTNGLDPHVTALALVAMIERFTHFNGRSPAERDRGLDTLAALTHRGVFADV